MLPLVDRELTRSARRKGQYALRMLIPACSFVLLGFIWYWMSLFGEMEDAGVVPFGSEWLGRTLTTAAFAFQAAVVMIMAPLLSAGTVTQEKLDRTLGLLLLADMGGIDIALSKWISTFVQVEMLLLTTLPVLAIAALFGGVAVPVMVLQVVLLSAAAGTVCAVGLLMSTLAARTGEAIVATLVMVVAYSAVVRLAGTWIWPGLRVDIFTAAYQSETLLLLGPFYWIRPLVVAFGVSALCLSLAAWHLPSQAIARTVARRRSTGVVAVFTRPLQFPRRRAIPKEPVSAFIQRCSIGLATSIRPTLLKAIVSLVLGLVSVMICAVGMPLIVALLAYDITSSMQHLKKTGMLDDLRLTALDPRQWARGIYLGHVRRCWMYFPAIFVNALYGLGMMSMMIFSPVFDDTGFSVSDAEGYALLAFGVLILFAYATLLLRMLVAAACFFSRTTMAVGVQTLLVVVVYVVMRVALTVAMGMMTALSIGIFTPSGPAVITQDWALVAAVAFMNFAAVILLLLFFRQVHRESFSDTNRFEV